MSDHTAGTDGAAGALPAYTDYLASPDDGEPSVVYADVETLRNRETVEADNDSDVSELDPVLAGSLQGMGVLVFTARLALGTFGLGALLEDEQAGLETTVSEVVLADGAFVFRGSVDRDELDERLRTPGGGLLASAYEQTGEKDGRTVYTAVDDGQSVGIEGTDVNTVAVGASEFVASGPTGVDRVLGAVDGDRTRAAEAVEPFEWLLSTAGDADSVVAGYGPGGVEIGGENDDEDDFVAEHMPELQEAAGLATSLSFDTDTVETTAAAVFDDTVSDQRRAEVAAMAGSDADERSCTADGNRLVLSATYDVDHIRE